MDSATEWERARAALARGDTHIAASLVRSAQRLERAEAIQDAASVAAMLARDETLGADFAEAAGRLARWVLEEASEDV